MPPLRLVLLASVSSLVSSGQAFGWAETGHRIVTTAAVEALPADLPPFLKTPESLWRLGELGREPDRSRSAGQPHGADLEPAHYLDVDDTGRIEGGPFLRELPPNRAAYEAALQAAGSNSWKAGYLPYAMIEGWQQLVKDFAYWRVDSIGERTAGTADARAWFAADRALRETIILRDLGQWSHFVADAGQPLHVSVHHNGWDGDNPQGYSGDRLHAPLEGRIVRAVVTPEAVRAAMPAYVDCRCRIQAATISFLQASNGKLEPLYSLWGQGAFANGDARGTAFLVERLAASAAEVRDRVVDAWRASADSNVGYPPVSVRSIEAGRPAPLENLYGRE